MEKKDYTLLQEAYLTIIKENNLSIQELEFKLDEVLPSLTNSAKSLEKYIPDETPRLSYSSPEDDREAIEFDDQDYNDVLKEFGLNYSYIQLNHLYENPNTPKELKNKLYNVLYYVYKILEGRHYYE